MKHKLLVPVDGKKASWKTALYAGRACAGHGAKTWGVVLFHILSDAGNGTGREERESAKAMLAAMKERLVQEGVQAEAVSAKVAKESGDIVQQILWAATNENCDTIVVGRRGKSMFGQFLSHGVVEQLLRNPTGFTVWVVE